MKEFMMTSLLLEREIELVENKHGVSFGQKRERASEEDSPYYSQIDHQFRAEASRMAPLYEIFYSLERTIRAFVGDTLESEYGPSWQENRIPSSILDSVKKRRTGEIDKAITPRSDDLIDFTTFGELGQIIRNNWEVFAGIFSSEKAVERVMASLNSLRAPIAHCTELAEDEVVRLQLSVKDWFRLME
ncbi:Swt1 family HEPN domain-containing protein [Saccharopolyspora sp. 6M]|uniref:Swt1 family HEPN domain-containing protein n=1 Tax=Saccharopolyspora sp. 6M TaxID=2877237 RepID=UPI001CD251EE|nr:Swt1 family HEPN domain-containing protein [Saccharopolyspora sp. 6M]MCA1224932.1 hypothetical protein [Saccharopolyspora sp. 6M]